jgi:hypothetical protein
MIYLNIGEPDFTAPPAVARRCRPRGARPHAVHRCPRPARLARGHFALVCQRFGLDIAPERIVITAGASAGLQLACLALFERGDEVLMPDPCYPCNRHFVAAADAKPRLLPTGAAERFQLGAAPGARCLDSRDARRAAGLAEQPDRHLDAPEVLAASPASCANAAASRWSTRSTWASQLRRAIQPQRAGAGRRRRSRSTASPSTSA